MSAKLDLDAPQMYINPGKSITSKDGILALLECGPPVLMEVIVASMQYRNGVTLLLDTTSNVIRHKVGLLNLADELDNFSNFCNITGVSPDTFYRYKVALESNRVETMIEKMPAQKRLYGAFRYMGNDTQRVSKIVFLVGRRSAFIIEPETGWSL